MRTPVVACAELKKTDRKEPTHFCPNSRKRRIPVIGPLWRAALREKQGPAVAAPEGLLNQLSFLPSRNPKSAGPLKRTQILPAARLHRPTAQRFLPPLGTPIVPPLLVHPRRDHPAGLPFPARNGPPAARAPSVPPSTCGESIPLEGYLPARPEPSGVLTVYPGVAGAGSRERSRTREAFGVRPRAGAVEEPHCARRPTDPDLLASNDRSFARPHQIHRARPSSTPSQSVKTLLAWPRHAGAWGGRPRQGLTARPLRGQTDDRAFHTAAASRRSPCAAATPHGALRGREAFGVRPRAGAIWGTATVPRSATRLRMVCTPAGSVAQSTALSLGYPASSPARGG
jgi:hypothetical protein